MIANEMRDLAISYIILYLIFGILYGTLIFVIVVAFLSIGYKTVVKKNKQELDENMKKAAKMMEKLVPKEENKRRNKK